MALGEINVVKFEHDFTPEAKGVGFVEDEVETATNGAPFALEDGPGGLGGTSDLLRRGLAGATFGGEVGNFVFDEGAD